MSEPVDFKGCRVSVDGHAIPPSSARAYAVLQRDIDAVVFDGLERSWYCMGKVLVEPPEANSPEFEEIKTSPVPKFNHAAKRKLELLQVDGATITGYAIEKDGRRGAIDCHGFVYWWNHE